MKYYVVIVGSLASGVLTVHGPFMGETHASRWAIENVKPDAYVVVETQVEARKEFTIMPRTPSLDNA